jgi:tetratricopeptide (TPR) repeat protein
MNIQQTLLGELVEEDVLSEHEKAILDVLCWVPGLGGDLLFETVGVSEGLTEDQATDAVQALLLKCLITVSGFVFSVSPAIRHLYRRRYVTPAGTTDALAQTLSSAWTKVERDGAFREDLFEASIYVQTMRGTPVPEGLKNLITPGFLEGLVKETFARAKNTENADDLRRVISLGQMAFDMKMTDAVREEIYGTTARAQIRASDFTGAAETIGMMEARGYVNAVFLLGYMFRKQENYPEAIRVLKDAVTRHKHDRAAINELAQAYKRSDDFSSLRQLLEQHSGMVPKSAVLTDFQIGLDFADGKMPEVEAGIARLKSMPDNDGRSDRREALLLMKKGRFADAQRLLTAMLERKGASYFLVRSLRAKAAIHAPDHRQAQRDIDVIRAMPGRAPVALRLQIELEAARGRLPQAEALLSTLGTLKPHDFLLKALVLEKKAEEATTGMVEAAGLRKEASDLRGRYRGGHDRYEE